jgi:transposase
LAAENVELRRQLAFRDERIAALEVRLAELERRLGQNSGNSSLPSSRDPVGERQRQACQRAERLDRAGRPKRKRGKQRGSEGKALEMSPDPDVIVDHDPEICDDCGEGLGAGSDEGYTSRQVVELPEVRPVVTEHRAHRRRCRCGHVSSAAFPADVRAPISYGPRVKALVAYLLARQHLPGRRVAETLLDCFGLNISTGTIDAVYSEAARRLGARLPPWSALILPTTAMGKASPAVVLLELEPPEARQESAKIGHGSDALGRRRGRPGEPPQAVRAPHRSGPLVNQKIRPDDPILVGRGLSSSTYLTYPWRWSGAAQLITGPGGAAVFGR